jgi:hypothetical protein
MVDRILLSLVNRLVKENKDFRIESLNNTSFSLSAMDNKVSILFEEKSPVSCVIAIKTTGFEYFTTDIIFSFREYANTGITEIKVVNWINSIMEHINKIVIADNL